MPEQFYLLFGVDVVENTYEGFWYEVPHYLGCFSSDAEAREVGDKVCKAGSRWTREYLEKTSHYDDYKIIPTNVDDKDPSSGLYVGIE